jgi:hypothetical protein
MRLPLLVVAACFLVLCGRATADDPTAKPKPADLKFFEENIRPVLVAQCYECHSAKALQNKTLKGALLLDTREGIRKGGESGPAVVPGKVDDSLLIEAIRHESVEMPPKSKLPDNVIADFVKWVELGAPDPRDGRATTTETKIDFVAARKFWSFQPLGKFTPPPVQNKDWLRTPLDQFVLARLETAKVVPNNTASRRTLIRRIYFDLWGLPPEPADVEAFVADSSPDAYSELIDHLLESDHYGERWARHWLDLARFAESNGYAFDKDRPNAYHYRDFVIKALNEGMPYDRFIRLQIAGDQMESASYMAQAATGFLAAGPFTSQQTQKERERSRYEQLDDLIATVGTATLGLTVGCARCHDHKYDPITQRDYYRMIAAFAQTGFQDFPHDRQPEVYRKAKTEFDAAHKPFTDARAAYEKEHLPTTFTEWSRNRPAEAIQPKLSPWHVAGPFAAADFDKAFDQAFPPEKKVDLAQTFFDGKVKWTPQPTWVDGKVHNTLTGDNSANYLFRTIEVPTGGPLEISLGRDDAIKVWLNGKVVLSKKVSGAAVADQDKVKLTLKAGRNELLLKIVNGGGPSGFYFKAINTDPPKNILAILNLTAEKRNAKQKQELLKWFAPYDAGWRKLNEAEQEHQKSHPEQDLVQVFAARKGGTTYNFGADTRKVYFLSRGNSNLKTGLATPGFMQLLMLSPEQEKRWTLTDATGGKDQLKPPRIAFANWLTDVEQGAGQLLARVIVNRLWQHHFGRGIVSTPSDFGIQGERPTHPQLLDYLATELIRGGWKLKPIHKLIMSGSVYMQTSESNDAGVQADPANKLWWRRPARRMEAEVIRDSMLAISGTLDHKMFGPGSLNQQDRRRSVYLKVKRGTLIPMLQLFDAPDAMQGIGQRTITTVPPQALAMMNSPFVRQLAEQFSKRVRPNADKSLEQTVDDAYAIALCRPPTVDERSLMLTFIKNQAESYGNAAAGTDTAVTDFCQLMLCLNEFLFVD